MARSEHVQVYGYPNNWRANASALNGYNVMARATSIRVMSTTWSVVRQPNYVVEQSQTSQLDGHTYDNGDITLGTASNMVCFLTRVSGRFDGYGEYAEVRVVNGVWKLRTESYGWNNGITATAKCVSLLS